jgi:hypothetical protein
MKTLPIKLIFVLFLTYFFGLPSASVFAANLYAPAVTHSVSIGGQVGEFTVSLSGFIAPYASVVMTIDSTVVRSTVADANGNFFLSQIVVKGGFDHYCLTAVDVRRLGQSKACFTIQPITGSYTKTGIFLPPTLGLYKKEINVGQAARAWGYSMPGAVVTLHTSDGRTFTVTADKTGYYEFDPKFDKAGDFELFADATYQKQKSENPVEKVTLKALSAAEQIGKVVENGGKGVGNLLGGPWGFLLIAIPIIILIIILLRKLLQRRKITPAGKKPLGHKFGFDYFFRKRKLHHAYFVGY